MPQGRKGFIMTPNELRIAEKVKTLEQVLSPLNQHGYESYLIDSGGYAFIKTPKDNVLYVQINNLSHQAEISICWQRSIEHGTGGRCTMLNPSDISMETMEQAENKGLKFAQEVKASLYSNSNKFFDNYWEKHKLRKISHGETPSKPTARTDLEAAKKKCAEQDKAKLPSDKLNRSDR
jgi:hypothetical protein